MYNISTLQKNRYLLLLLFLLLFSRVFVENNSAVTLKHIGEPKMDLAPGI